MALPRDYNDQACSLARSLEIIGERWTLLIVRDAFYGVRRFGDFAAHLRVPRAVLTERLKSLTAEGVLNRVPGEARWEEYELTAKGLDLWPVIRGLVAWGDDNYAPAGPRRLFRHLDDDGELDAAGFCAQCGGYVPVQDICIVPGPGLPPETPGQDVVTTALAAPHRMLQPLHPAPANARP